MNSGSWPYMPEQCPTCAYFYAAIQAYTDDSGYEIVGFCRHPRIAMELFRPQQLRSSASERCPLFVQVARSRAKHDAD